MAKKKGSGLQKFIIVGVFLIIISGAVLARMKLFAPPVIDSRTVIDEGIKSARQTKNLTPEQEQLLRLQIAIVDYMAKNRLPPASLNDLVPVYFDVVPLNPVTKKPYFYERSGGRYALRLDDKPIQLAAASGGTSNSGADGGSKDSSQPGIAAGADFVNPNEMQVEDFTYTAEGKRDPFRPFDVSRRPLKDSTKSPLEQFSLTQLRVAAVLEDATTGSKAIVQTDDGQGYTVTVGTKVGDSGGVVVSIEPNMVKVLETQIEPYTGVEKQNVVEMKLIGEPAAEDKSKGKDKKKQKK